MDDRNDWLDLILRAIERMRNDSDSRWHAVADLLAGGTLHYTQFHAVRAHRHDLTVYYPDVLRGVPVARAYLGEADPRPVRIVAGRPAAAAEHLDALRRIEERNEASGTRPTLAAPESETAEPRARETLRLRDENDRMPGTLARIATLAANLSRDAAAHGKPVQARLWLGVAEEANRLFT